MQRSLLMEQIASLRSDTGASGKLTSKIGPAEHWQVRSGDFIKIKINSKEVQTI
jgi:hypothetical protein